MIEILWLVVETNETKRRRRRRRKKKRAPRGQTGSNNNLHFKWRPLICSQRNPRVFFFLCDAIWKEGATQGPTATTSLHFRVGTGQAVGWATSSRLDDASQSSVRPFFYWAASGFGWCGCRLAQVDDPATLCTNKPATRAQKQPATHYAFAYLVSSILGALYLFNYARHTIQLP